MPEHTFTHRAKTLVTEPLTDIDGEVYPGERLDLISTLTFSTEACEQTGSIHAYGMHDDTGAKVSAIKVFLTDEMNHEAELTMTPDELQRVADWFQEQARQAQCPQSTDRDRQVSA